MCFLHSESKRMLETRSHSRDSSMFISSSSSFLFCLLNFIIFLVFILFQFIVILYHLYFLFLKLGVGPLLFTEFLKEFYYKVKGFLLLVCDSTTKFPFRDRTLNLRSGQCNMLATEAPDS